MSRTILKHSYLPHWTLLFLLLGHLAALAQPATPTVSITDPPTNTTVRALTFINTFFEDNVRGVDASDLLINGAPATNILVVSPREYVFYFPAPAPGPVTVAWAGGHGITDLGDPPTPFAGGSWSYTVDPAANPPTLIISEFLADNNSGIKDEDGSRQDWIEIYNPGPGDASLGGWFLTDNATNLTKWQFPSVPLLAGKYLLVWASAKNRTDPAAPLHTNFRLAKEGSYLALVNPSTNVASEFDPYPPQQADVSYGRDRADANLLGYFPTPTPGAQNVVTGPSVTPDPVLSVASGVYTNATLTLAMSATLGTIRYTLDTTVPTTNSPTYSSPITFGTNLVVKARAFPPQNSGLLPSRVVAGSYLFLDGTTADFSSPLPILIINTDGGAINPDVTPGSPRREGTLTIIDTFRGRSSIRSEPDFHGLAGYEIFGQTSAGFPKRPFRIEIHDELGNDLKVPVLGMPADSDFKLRNPYDDKTMLNDFLAFELFDQMGHYSVRRRMVETFVDTGGGRLNYASDYYGIMTFVETIKQGKDRVDINEITPAATNEPAITGGYIFKKDKDSAGDYNFATAGGNFGGNVWPAEALKIHEPKPNALRTAPISGPLTPSGVKQMAWLTAYLNQMEKALYATNWLTLTGTNHYSNYLDVDSFVDFHWLVEFTKQIDGYRLSGYFTKDRGGKVVNGPAWDWNLAFGNADYLDGGHTNTWYYSEQGQGMTANEHIWLRRLINGNPNMGPGDAPGPGGDPDFNQKIADRWGVLRTNILNGPRVIARIEELSSGFSESADRDFAKYRTLSQAPPNGLWPNPAGNLNHDGVAAPGRPWDVDYVRPPSYRNGTNSIIGFMKKWVDGRYNWIDAQFTAAPQLVGTSGQVSSGTTVQITHAAGTMLYYTLDGTDPRAPGGGVQAGTLSNAGPVTVTVTSNTRIVARATASGSWYGTWSPPAAGTYFIALPPLRITEIMYHPSPLAGNTNDADVFEYIEVKNTGATPLNLQRFHLANGVQFDFPNVVLNAGQSGVVVANTAQFQARYGSGPFVLGQYTGRLDNGGERIVLEGPVREPILDFSYDPDWYKVTDGFGFSLVVNDENANPAAWGTQAQWHPSGTLNGTPGASEGAPPNIPAVVINEALTHSEPAPPTDTIELRNLTGVDADIGGWYLSDDFRNPKKYRIPFGTVIPANGYRTFDESAFNVGGNGNIAFALSADGDELYLYSADVDGNLTGYLHGFSFGAQRAGVTFGRYVISSGEEHFVAQTSPTLNGPNSGPLIGPVVITELMYRPPDIYLNGALWNNPEDEFIELHNLSSSPVALFDPAHPANTWMVDNDVHFTFPPGITLPAGGFMLLVNFNPTTSPTQAAAFRAKYSVGAAVQLAGPYGKNLDNGNANISLYMPDAPTTNGSVPYVLVDRVRYTDHLPWPSTADGLGPSLQRLVESNYGDDPANWIAVGPTAGASYVPGGNAPIVNLQPVDTTVVGGNTAMLSVSVTGTAPLFYQWRFNGVMIPNGNGPILTLSQVRPDQDGLYDVTVYNPAGSTNSASAHLTVLIPVSIATQPLGVNLRGSTNNADYGFTTNNATFTVNANIQRPTRYQWRFNGAPLPGQTSSTLVVPNVGLTQDGNYDVVVTDDVSTTTSAPARLKVLCTPFYLVVPPSITIASNSSFSASAVIRGNPPPYRYEWREISAVRAANVVDESTNFFTSAAITNRLPTQPTTWRLVVFNDAAPTVGAVAQFTVTSLPDTDGDGMPDDWETQYGLDPNVANSHTTDSDGDGMSDYAEYLAGTNPRSDQSSLRTQIDVTSGTAQISVGILANHTYTLQASDRLTGGWTRLADIVERPSDRVETIIDPTPGTNRFYRLVTPRQ